MKLNANEAVEQKTHEHQSHTPKSDFHGNENTHLNANTTIITLSQHSTATTTLFNELNWKLNSNPKWIIKVVIFSRNLLAFWCACVFMHACDTQMSDCLNCYISSVLMMLVMMNKIRGRFSMVCVSTMSTRHWRWFLWKWIVPLLGFISLLLWWWFLALIASHLFRLYYTAMTADSISFFSDFNTEQTKIKIARCYLHDKFDAAIHFSDVIFCVCSFGIRHRNALDGDSVSSTN